MALINCSECEKQISDTAKSCPSCGHPVAAVTIEATGKRFKGLQVIGLLIFIVGFIFLFINPPTGIIGTLLGLGLYIYSRFGAWWQHG